MIRRIRPDVIHAHSSKAGALVRILGKTSPQRPRFYTPNAYYGMGRSGLLARVFNVLERLLTARGININISADEVDFAVRNLGLRPGSVMIIPNPVRVSHFLPATSQQKLRARRALGFPEQGLIIGTVGRLSYQKDPLTASKSLVPLLKKYPELYFAHLGHGELLEEVEAYLEKEGLSSRVLRPDYLEDPLPFYHALDAFLLTSRYEAGIPFVLLEALSCGLPVVSTIPPGMSELNRMGLSHCLTTGVGDVEGLTRCLQELILSHPEAVTTNHREIIEKTFSPESCYGAVLEEYRNALNAT